jgi:pyruvate dehydrogenase E2 component (dihydrolipoamide acetyltransferase)
VAEAIKKYGIDTDKRQPAGRLTHNHKETNMALVEVKVPDIGDFKDVEVIELLVKVGDTVKVEQSLLTVESDKASMEIPSSHAGVVKEMKVKLGDKVGEGSLLLLLEGEAAAAAAAQPPPQQHQQPRRLPRPPRLRRRPRPRPALALARWSTSSCPTSVTSTRWR